MNTKYMILVLNCGSQSIKWKLFDGKLNIVKKESFTVFNAKDYKKNLINELNKLKKYKDKIKIIGHRVVHGGQDFVKPLKINQKNLKKLEKFNKLAPLHNPFNILGIKTARVIFPKPRQIAVFDTEFFAGLGPKANIYPLPEKIRAKYGIKRFGFHGISHEYTAEEGARIIGRNFKKLKIITCHLGGGASITAINEGRAIDTSMGFTPMEGLVMMTRPGNIDPGIILYLAQKQRFKIRELDYILNNESGVRGLCGFSDMRDVLRAVKKGSKKAKLALEIFVYSIQKYIGAYFAILSGCDLLVFTGAIGSGSAKIINMICRNLNILKHTRVISVKPDEELAIAKKIRRP